MNETNLAERVERVVDRVAPVLWRKRVKPVKGLEGIETCRGVHLLLERWDPDTSGTELVCVSSTELFEEGQRIKYEHVLSACDTYDNLYPVRPFDGVALCKHWDDQPEEVIAFMVGFPLSEVAPSTLILQNSPLKARIGYIRVNLCSAFMVAHPNRVFIFSACR